MTSLLSASPQPAPSTRAFASRGTASGATRPRTGHDEGDVGAPRPEGGERPHGRDQVLTPRDGTDEEKEATGPDAMAGAHGGDVDLAHEPAEDRVNPFRDHRDS